MAAGLTAGPVGRDLNMKNHALEALLPRQWPKEVLTQKLGDRYTVVKDTNGFTVLDENGEVTRALNSRGYVKNRDKEVAESVAAHLNEATRKVPKSEQCRRWIVAGALGENGDILLCFYDGSASVGQRRDVTGDSPFAKNYHCADEVSEESLPKSFYGASPRGLCQAHKLGRQLGTHHHVDPQKFEAGDGSAR